MFIRHSYQTLLPAARCLFSQEKPVHRQLKARIFVTLPDFLNSCDDIMGYIIRKFCQANKFTVSKGGDRHVIPGKVVQITDKNVTTISITDHLHYKFA